MPEPGSHSDWPDELARYSRQILFPPLGVDGQRKLRHASVALVGCGALGSALADLLVRAGVGFLRLIDRDFIETSNLQRQSLFDEHDIAQNLPKAEAAARKLRKINSAVEVEGLVADLNHANALHLLGTADLILDGTDNLETRYLINDVAVQANLPWVYGACVGAEGLVLPIRPHQTPCLRCIWEEPLAPGELPTCDTVGVLASAVHIVASFQAIAALKLLTGCDLAATARLLAIDAWAGRVRSVNVQAAYDDGDCPCCKQQRYEFLSGARAAAAAVLCGRDAVQVLPAGDTPVNFKALAARLPAQADARYNEYLLRFRVEAFRVTLFADGRAIVQGTTDPSTARAVLARYVGN